MLGFDRRSGRSSRRIAALQALDPRQQGTHRAVDVGPGRLRERELQARASVRAGSDCLECGAEQLQQAHHDPVVHPLGLRLQGGVGLGGQRELRRHLAEDLHHEQLPGAHLEVRREGARVAALLDALLKRRQGAAGVSGGDRVDGGFEQ